MRTFLILFIFISSTTYAGTLGNSVQKTESAFGTNTGNQTIVNVQKEQPDPDLMPSESKGYKESKLTIYFEGVPYIFPFGYTDRQFSQSTFAIGAIWKVDEHFHGLVKYLNFDAKGPDSENMKATHYMYGLGMRYTVGGNHQIQLNIGSSTSEVKWINGSSYEMPVFGEFKYLWCSDNTAYGIVLTAFDMPKKHNEGEQYQNAGFMYVAFTFEVGLPDF